MRAFHYCEGEFHFGNVAAWCNNLPALGRGFPEV